MSAKLNEMKKEVKNKNEIERREEDETNESFS